MMNRVFQDTIYNIGCFMDRTVGVVDGNGIIIASSDLEMLGQYSNINFNDLSIDRAVVAENKTFKLFGEDNTGYYALFCYGQDSKSLEYTNILTVAVNGIKTIDDDRKDRVKFIKNIILDNILPGDVVIRARELHFNTENNRVAIIIRLDNRMSRPCYEIVRSIFPDTSKDFVFYLNENDTVLIKEVKQDTTIKDIEKMAVSIIETLGDEYFVQAKVGIGSIINTIRHLSRSFKEAQISLEVGKVFYEKTNISTYDYLGIGRLIYQLPTTLCEMFLKEVFRTGSIDSLDNETLLTIQTFFKNNLNVSETSRSLFIHRNTLVYRLEKIRKLTGLDLREFDQAIIFKVALMVTKYLKSRPVKY
ncbi:MAG: PucR family transcriptional regulator [Oscillospiraceae bacterium]